jgi:hypothetical protein
VAAEPVGGVDAGRHADGEGGVDRVIAPENAAGGLERCHDERPGGLYRTQRELAEAAVGEYGRDGEPPAIRCAGSTS